MKTYTNFINEIRIAGFTHEDPVPHHIDSWYDRRTRSWVTQLMDKDGNQIGDADYSPSKKGRDLTVTQWKKEYNLK